MFIECEKLCFNASGLSFFSLSETLQAFEAGVADLVLLSFHLNLNT
jgi:hypothetical protein